MVTVKESIRFLPDGSHIHKVGHKQIRHSEECPQSKAVKKTIEHVLDSVENVVGQVSRDMKHLDQTLHNAFREVRTASALSPRTSEAPKPNDEASVPVSLEFRIRKVESSCLPSKTQVVCMLGYTALAMAAGYAAREQIGQGCDWTVEQFNGFKTPDLSCLSWTSVSYGAEAMGGWIKDLFQF